MFGPRRIGNPNYLKIVPRQTILVESSLISIERAARRAERAEGEPRRRGERKTLITHDLRRAHITNHGKQNLR